MNVFGKGMMPVKLYLFALVLCGLVAYGQSQGCTCESEDRVTVTMICNSNDNNPTRKCCVDGSIVSVVFLTGNNKCTLDETFFPSVGARCFVVTDKCKGTFEVKYCPDGGDDDESSDSK